MMQEFRLLYLPLFILNLCFIPSIFPINVSPDKPPSVKDKMSNTGLLADSADETIFISTLDGNLHAVTKGTGTIKWTLKNEPVIYNSNNSEDVPVPKFFPNPKDGSLYRYTTGRGRDPLKKLPFTIPELVANSPCRSNDGIFYIGKKVDTWVGIDATTGKKQMVLGADSIDKVCPTQSRDTIYLGRTMYNIVLFEMNTEHKWNVSFFHYTTSSNSNSVKDYDLVHYAAAGMGTILTVDQKTGTTLWDLEFDSPVVAMYILDSDSSLASIPLITVTPQTLSRFSDTFDRLSDMEFTEHSSELLVKELSPTIFVGETENGVYAIPAFVDTDTARISRKKDQLLLDGPPGQRGTMGKKDEGEEDDTSPYDVLLLGYYDIPENAKTELSRASVKELKSLKFPTHPLAISDGTNSSSKASLELDGDSQSSHAIFWRGVSEIRSLNATFIFSVDSLQWTYHLSRMSFMWLISDPLNFMVACLTVCLGFIMVLLYRQAQDYARLSREFSSRRANSSRSSASGSSGSDITSVAEELEDGRVRVGKIFFEPDNLLGKGCDGTFVFKGAFDGRSIAVKRVLPGCFSIADREVDLLRESDQHPNVIRYYCMEQCRQFRYIALELCAATLDDFVRGRVSLDVSSIEILRQATAGLHHLHSLDIVHRDIKPHNVLLSTPNSKGEVRAMISDFGLCKRLEVGRMSFSKRSGVTGTEGWIAPEMMTTARPTCKVDIFSMGCVYYYVLSKGKHPFGSLLDRQSNILSGKYNLDELSSDDFVLCYSIVTAMISAKPNDRPPTDAILSHPLFWYPEKVLQFFQDTSDRVEKEQGNSIVIKNLEWGAIEVVKEDWTKHMHPMVGEDLRRFREYNGKSVRDLLRALRNKKNHYRELSEDARRVFGRIPEDFVPYWTLRFPRLLLHAWYALQCCKSEPIFSRYYYNGFNFKPENLHNIVSFAPNNRPRSFGSSNSPGRISPRHQRENKKQSYDFLDSILGPPVMKRGPKRQTKLEKDDSNSVWLLRKPQNTFEPQYYKGNPSLSLVEKSEDNFDAEKINSELISSKACDDVGLKKRTVEICPKET